MLGKPPTAWLGLLGEVGEVARGAAQLAADGGLSVQLGWRILFKRDLGTSQHNGSSMLSHPSWKGSAYPKSLLSGLTV